LQSKETRGRHGDCRRALLARGRPDRNIVIARPPRITPRGRELWQDRTVRPTLPRLFAAVPDAITAALYLTAWIAPGSLGPEAVRNLMLTMLIESVVMHSSGFYAGIAAAGEIARGKRALILAGLTAFYFVFIIGFSIAFDSTWPLFAFGWLFVSRFMHLWTRP